MQGQIRLAVICMVLVVATPGTASLPAAGFSFEQAADNSQRALLVRRDAGGQPDLRFGEGGRAVLDGIHPSRVVTDARGNLLVVGRTTQSPSVPAVLRLTPGGRPDLGWGTGGLSAGAPVAGPALATEAVPLGDGRMLLLGRLEAPTYRAALWVIDAGGRFEASWLLHVDGTGSWPLSMTVIDGGPSLMVALGTLHPKGPMSEAHIFTPARGTADPPERLVRQSLPDDWTATPLLARVKQRWFWTDPERPDIKPIAARASDENDDRAQWAWQTARLEPARAAAMPTATGPLPMAMGEPSSTASGGAAFLPFTAAPPSPAPRQDAGLALWVAGLLLAGAIYAVARLLSHKDD
jgi:hypothetical protein